MTETWYQEGLPFSCTGCGQCCTGSPGYAWVTEEEMREMADYLNLSFRDFTIRYIRRVGNRYALVELRKQQYDCIFLKDKKCTVYPVRPKQCRTYPWWPENLKSPEAWAAESARCEGMRNAPDSVPFETIQKTLREHLTS